MPRFFLSHDECTASFPSLTLTGDDARHVGLSLRMAVGDALTVSDGEGTDHLCVIEQITPSTVQLRAKESRASQSEPPYRLTLYQAVPKGDKLEEIVQKAVELGCARIVPFLSEHCVSRPDAKKWAHKKDRLSRIALEAAKQCGRGRIPTMADLLPFDGMLDALKGETLSLFCYENERTHTLPRTLPCDVPPSIALIVGSEGGFSQKEAEQIETAGALAVSLGTRILRCETAPLYALAVISSHYEL